MQWSVVFLTKLVQMVTERIHIRFFYGKILPANFECHVIG